MKSALSMRVELARLRRTHNITVAPVTIALSPPTGRAQILHGLASTTDIDLQHTKLRGWAFGAVHRQPPPRLLYKHDATREVGTIDHLAYDASGALMITATVTCPLARRCNAFSIGANVRDYEIINADTPGFYALIRQATLDEISLTDIPANPAARVTARRDVSAHAEFYTHAQSHIAHLQKLVTLIQGAHP